MSKLVKSSQITIDRKKYILSTDFFVPNVKKDSFDSEEDGAMNFENKEEAVNSLEDELRIMKETMLEEVKKEKDDKLLLAKEEFDNILGDAYNQADSIKESSRNEGYDTGYNEGLVNGYNEAQSFIDEALAIKGKYNSKYEGLKEEFDGESYNIIISTVEKILNKHVSEDYDLIKNIVEKAIAKCAFTMNLTLRVSPEDFDSAVSYKSYILSLTENIDHIDIKPDGALQRGSCIIDTDAGSVDSSVHTQFEIIRNKFLEILKSE